MSDQPINYSAIETLDGAACEALLEDIGKLPEGWDEEGAPAITPKAIAEAKRFIEWVLSEGLVIFDVSADVLGGIAVMVGNPLGKHVWAAFANNGKSTLLYIDGQNVRSFETESKSFDEVIQFIPSGGIFDPFSTSGKLEIQRFTQISSIGVLWPVHEGSQPSLPAPWRWSPHLVYGNHLKAWNIVRDDPYVTLSLQENGDLEVSYVKEPMTIPKGVIDALYEAHGL